MNETDKYIEASTGWQQQNLIAFRDLLHELLPDIQEDFKWGVPVFLIGTKLVCAMSVFKNHTKFNFFEGAKLADVQDLFNSGLDSKQHRSVNVGETDQLNRDQLKKIIRAAADNARNS